MNKKRIAAWMSQFQEADLDLAVKILQNIRYYSGSNIRQMLRQLAAMVYGKLPRVPRTNIYFIPVGRPGGGGAIVSRALADTPGVRRTQIKFMNELEALPPDEIGGIVFIDDFSGTGSTLSGWWENVEALVRPKAAPIVVALLVLNRTARLPIEKFATVLLAVHELGEDENAMALSSGTFDDQEKDALLAYCRSTGCSEEYVQGRGKCGLLLAFKHVCPNNSLPILWHESRQWRSLFLRRAI